MTKPSAAQRLWTALKKFVAGSPAPRPVTSSVPEFLPRQPPAAGTANRAFTAGPKPGASRSQAQSCRPAAASLTQDDSTNFMNQVLLQQMLANEAAQTYSDPGANSGPAPDTSCPAPSFDPAPYCPAPDPGCWTPSDFGSAPSPDCSGGMNFGN